MRFFHSIRFAGGKKSKGKVNARCRARFRASE
jgi:hypothetical protein